LFYFIIIIFIYFLQVTNLKWDGLNYFKRFLANLTKTPEKKEENENIEKLEVI
jgi:hypothetical protein